MPRHHVHHPDQASIEREFVELWRVVDENQENAATQQRDMEALDLRVKNLEAAVLTLTGGR